MARSHFFWYITNEEGQPVNAADITIYSAGTTTPMFVYLQEAGGAAIDTIPQVVTNNEGFCEFWIADSSEVNGYVSGSKFSLNWSKPGVIDDGSIDNIDFITPRVLSTTTESLSTTGWTSSGGQYYYDLAHELNNEYPIAMLYNDASKMTEAITIESISVDTIRLWKSDSPSCKITVIG